MEQWFYFIRSPLDDLDETIQELVYRSFYQFVYRDINFMVRDHALTEDIIQDAFMKAITKDLRCKPTRTFLPGSS